jgi:hypothetical protein
MKIGFLFNTFHSEVLDFLLELVQNQNNVEEVFVYNDADNYQNMNVYQKKYKFTHKGLNDFFYDTVNNVYDKTIVLTHSNLFALNFVEKYKDKFIFIAHSEKDLKQLEEHKLKYITLTQLLSLKGNGEVLNKNVNWMLPVTKTNTEDKHYEFYNVKDLEDNEIYNKRLLYMKQNNLTPIMMIGHFLHNNKNTDIIKQILKTKSVYLYIFAPDVTDCLYELQEYNNYVFCGVRWKTAEIEKMIIKYNINHVLFSPSETSEFWKLQWSGTLCYALSRSMNLIMPYEIAKNYKLEQTVTVYNNVDDINEDFVKGICHKKEQIEKWRHTNYTRNEKVFNMLLKDTKIQEDDNVFEYIFDKPVTNNILYINSGEGMDTSWLLKNHDCKVKSCEKDLETAKRQKERMTLYGLLNNITIYNNNIGMDIKNGDIKIDDLDLEQTDMIVVKNENFNRQYEILESGAEFINKHKPKIIMMNREFIPKHAMDYVKQHLLREYNYTMKKVIREEMEIYVLEWSV